MRKDAIIYCRCSTKGQADKGYSLSRQLEVCWSYCESNGYHISAVFSDVQSGAKPHLLHGRKQALRMAHNRGCPIVVESFDRFSRSRHDQYPDSRLIECMGATCAAMAMLSDALDEVLPASTIGGDA